MECPENNWTGFFSVFTCKTTQTFTHLQSVNEPKRKLKTDVADLAKREDAKNPAKTKTKQQNTVGPKAISTKTNRRLLKVPLILAEKWLTYGLLTMFYTVSDTLHIVPFCYLVHLFSRTALAQMS